MYFTTITVRAFVSAAVQVTGDVEKTLIYGR